MTRVAVIQMNPVLGEIERNTREIVRHLDAAAGAGADLVVLPECAVTGYVFDSFDEARTCAESARLTALDRILQTVQRHALHCVVGTLECDEDRLFNTALLLGPHGHIASYRKTHTLCLGVDRYTTPGDLGLRVHSLPFGRIGMLICYDLRFPEPARVLALAGAQILALPTNWPASSTIQPEAFTRARAAENRMFLLAADRVGEERGAHFLGRSQIVGPDGSVCAEAGTDGAAMLIHDIHPADADEKHVIFRPGEHEMNIWEDRRSDLYGPIAVTRAHVAVG